MSEDLSSLAGFAGSARLFPLPNVVLFPHVIQPLHIFEARYRQMTADALESDRLIAMALLQPGWEASYAGAPPIHAMACLGRIVAEQRMDDGRFNILLRGLSRIRITEEVNCPSKLYRHARVELQGDIGMPDARCDLRYRKKLVSLVPPWFPVGGQMLAQFRKVLKSDLALPVLCDILAFALPLQVHIKQALLEEVDVSRRAKMLIHHLQEKKPTTAPTESEVAEVARKFPPEFSIN